MRIALKTKVPFAKLKSALNLQRSQIIRSLSHHTRPHDSSIDQPSYFITTPIFYVNGAPHIGHFHTLVLADALNRFHRILSRNENTIFCTGTDEHGIKVQKTAAGLNKHPKELCDEMSKVFRNLCIEGSIGNTHFIRTTEEHHMRAVHAFWRHLNDLGFIYKRKYAGWYSINDESFVAEKDTVEVVDNDGSKVRICTSTRSIVEWSEEENYMFKYSLVVDEVIKWLKNGPVVQPDRFVREAINQTLPEDISISRPKSRVEWGIEVPDDLTHTIYVWLDALINYLTIAGYPGRMSRWPPDCQIIGKDILRFHALLWPGFLIAAGLQLPKLILCHSHWQVDHVKMSKSIGNVVDPFEISQRMTWDGLRYFLLRAAVLRKDSNFVIEAAVKTVNADLPNDFGNLLSRSVAPALNKDQIFPSGILNENFIQEEAVSDLIQKLKSLPERCHDHFMNGEFVFGINNIMECLSLANQIFHAKEPWTLVKKEGHHEQLNDIMYLSLETLRICGILMQPVTPSVSTRVLDKLNIPKSQRYWDDAKWRSSRTDANNVHKLNPEKILAFARLK